MVNIMTFYKAKYMQYEGLASTVRFRPFLYFVVVVKVCACVLGSVQFFANPWDSPGKNRVFLLKIKGGNRRR